MAMESAGASAPSMDSWRVHVPSRLASATDGSGCASGACEAKVMVMLSMVTVSSFASVSEKVSGDSAPSGVAVRAAPS